MAGRSGTGAAFSRSATIEGLSWARSSDHESVMESAEIARAEVKWIELMRHARAQALPLQALMIKYINQRYPRPENDEEEAEWQLQSEHSVSSQWDLAFADARTEDVAVQVSVKTAAEAAEATAAVVEMAAGKAAKPAGAGKASATKAVEAVLVETKKEREASEEAAKVAAMATPEAAAAQREPGTRTKTRALLKRGAAALRDVKPKSWHLSSSPNYVEDPSDWSNALAASMPMTSDTNFALTEAMMKNETAAERLTEEVAAQVQAPEAAKAKKAAKARGQEAAQEPASAEKEAAVEARAEAEAQVVAAVKATVAALTDKENVEAEVDAKADAALAQPESDARTMTRAVVLRGSSALRALRRRYLSSSSPRKIVRESSDGSDGIAAQVSTADRTNSAFPEAAQKTTVTMEVTMAMAAADHAAAAGVVAAEAAADAVPSDLAPDAEAPPVSEAGGRTQGTPLFALSQFQLKSSLCQLWRKYSFMPLCVRATDRPSQVANVNATQAPMASYTKHVFAKALMEERVAAAATTKARAEAAAENAAAAEATAEAEAAKKAVVEAAVAKVTAASPGIYEAVASATTAKARAKEIAVAAKAKEVAAAEDEAAVTLALAKVTAALTGFNAALARATAAKAKITEIASAAAAVAATQADVAVKAAQDAEDAAAEAAAAFAAVGPATEQKVIAAQPLSRAKTNEQ